MFLSEEDIPNGDTFNNLKEMKTTWIDSSTAMSSIYKSTYKYEHTLSSISKGWRYIAVVYPR